MSFMLAGLVLWFISWQGSHWGRLLVAGFALGLAMVSKHVYLLVLAPTLGLAWIVNVLYYRTLPHRAFIIPGFVSATVFFGWQAYMVLYLGPATATENLASFREFTTGAALVFSPDLIQQSAKELLGLKVYMGWLVPALAYGCTRALARDRQGQQWATLLFLAAANLVWYILASVGWLRYAFPGLSVGALFVALIFNDLTKGFRLSTHDLREALAQRRLPPREWMLHGVLLLWLLAMIVLPLGQTAKDIVLPPFNAPAAMAAYLERNVPTDALIETWEPEMGFLTDHNYHFPPALLLNTAVGYIWYGGPPPSDEYRFVETQRPAYVLVGEFARWVELYPMDWLEQNYRLLTQIGAYELYELEE
jgi:hypothetical protein